MAFDPPILIPRKRKAKAAIGAFKFKKSQGANSAAMRNREDSNGNSGFGPTQSKPRKTTPRKPKGEGWMNMAPPNMTPKWRQKGPVGIPAPRKPHGRMGIMNRRPARKIGK